MQVGGLNIERYPPPPSVAGDSGEQDLGPVRRPACGEAAGCHRAHRVRQTPGRVNRPRPIVLTDPGSPALKAFGVLVAQPKRRYGTGFLLEAGEPNSVAFAFARAGIRPGFQPRCPDRPRLLRTPADTPRTATAGRSRLISTSLTVSTTSTRPAASVFFHELNALIRSNPVHGTCVSGSVLRWVSLGFHHVQAFIEREPGPPRGGPAPRAARRWGPDKTGTCCDAPSHQRASQRPPTRSGQP